jgi:ElaB/YqjD/DUF883 family membrane-anchored ribosome-binding protein
MQEASTNSTKSNSTKSVKAKYPEVRDIGNDLKALKDDVGNLASHVKEQGLRDLSEKAQESLESLQGMSRKMEQRIKEKPAQSLAIAFVTGLFASFLLGRK